MFDLLVKGVLKHFKKSKILNIVVEIDKLLHIRNLLGAHYNEWAISLSNQDVNNFANLVDQLYDKTFCNNCHNYITRDNVCFCNNLNLNKSNPLSYAVAIGSKKIIELMIEKGVIINKVNIDGDTLLFNAIESSSKEIVQMFLEKGLNINAVNNQGVTPLLKAMYINDDEIFILFGK